MRQPVAVVRWLRRLAPPLLVGVLPAALLCVGAAHFILNHFFSHAPFLLDSGWYSELVYRAGLFPRNPHIACDYAEWYFGVHFSPFLSVFSLVSELVPLDRIEWYAVFEAIVYLPIGLAVYLLASRLEPSSAWRRLAITMVTALAFTFNGLVLRMQFYPHYEGAIAGFISLLLAALVTGRIRLAWVFLIIAASVRDDAGFHIAMALSPFVYLHWRGVSLPVTRRALLAMIGSAVAASLVAMLCQKLIFDGASVLTSVYIGDPPYAHVNGAMLGRRAHDFVATCQVMYYPFVATCVIAALRRDGRYLLGWAAGAPWFVLNFLAAQDQKATFEAYTGFPYVASLLWIYVYGAYLAPRRLRAVVLELAVAAICLTSTLGLYVAAPAHVRRLAHEMAFTRSFDRARVHGFVDALREHRAVFGRIYVDYAVAAVALEAVTADDAWHAGVTDADTITFHVEDKSRAELMRDVAANHLDSCVQIIGTGYVVCSRRPLSTDVFGPTKPIVP